jgi:hypothetical protein
MRTGSPKAIVPLLLLAALSCKSEPRGTQAAAPQAPRPAPVRTTSVADSLTALIARFPTVPGALGEHLPDFTGDQAVFLAASSLGDSAVARLVDCMDSDVGVAATLHGKPVTLGVLCYLTLNITAYYEPYEAHAENDPHRYDRWPGYLTLPTTSARLRAAKRAWQEVVHKHAYVLE